MRRIDSAIADQEELELFLADMSYGTLGTWGEDGWPELTPLNFVYDGGCIYFHGSRIGQKMSNLKAQPRVTFSVAKEYAIIPSYYLDPKLACPATAYFKSVLIKGTAQLVNELEEKALALAAFMRKLQPEGGYAPIDPADADYLPQLRATAIVKINVETMSAKFKFGQNLTEPKRESIMDGLARRGAELDHETMELMRKYCPHHRSQT
ncbi:pyridoxamine 5'-phosphate oxidase family protein [Paenibacillus sp. YYML68]|uniref:pyridoxamine 5'-phosphate oxidase family protein n=1 Tax=Paenibacillus sp. YYML68 TaxID=2909250 RepID=UPI002492732B|nr:pyridoxamine 5'-phosphate oxidase family protein [Paenibacillus sp. YYML68]